ncbi:MAG TPA: flavohemoglobin expression-modulating QEGLA motif protein, partial [Pirellulales bacterium]|nr:flavohemoglobin expression-modulating QEGLA motif protein [Pirellulales bacterium]
MVPPENLDSIRRLSDAIVDAQRPIRVREAVKWDDAIEASVLASALKELPEVGPAYYATARPLPYDPLAKIAEFDELARQIETTLGRHHPIGEILVRNCREYQDVVRMLLARGTPEFYRLSRELYGSPKERFAGDVATIRDLGLLLHDILSGIPEGGLGANYPRDLTAEQVVEQLNERFDRYFGDKTVHARLDDGILSDAAAGADYVKIRRGGRFSRRDVDLLEVHEGWVHVGTSLNGARQSHATWLAKGPPCTMAIQEGLAVILEVVTFNATPDRARRLNNRILACDRAEDGADFREVCEFYRSEGYSEQECYQHAQRVFRGGVVSGGAPFTKDISYCKGFVMVYNFLRIAIRFGRPDLIPLLFLGKLTLDDIPVLAPLVAEGLISPPQYLPPHFRDLNGLALWMAYSNFLNRVN